MCRTVSEAGSPACRYRAAMLQSLAQGKGELQSNLASPSALVDEASSLQNSSQFCATSAWDRWSQWKHCSARRSSSSNNSAHTQSQASSPENHSTAGPNPPHTPRASAAASPFCAKARNDSLTSTRSGNGSPGNHGATVNRQSRPRAQPRPTPNASQCAGSANLSRPDGLSNTPSQHQASPRRRLWEKARVHVSMPYEGGRASWVGVSS